ncbi:MAG: hemerythrin domain-containing protein [Ignavibacteria bacterium]|nr:hemerythrin domain-containing protein [Ignavibacteria bacterium]MBT8382383.1 hemerythrin domain-containing protein [Ignavibacteria bacterium]MBT8391831.1 hemerythrin domain-containing protein [Ignavibacteria bacterium]NNJ51892.1 hemerythrin domain-containing protein [Ignavibacteriaceae bacterium]NNL21100.1 hemerythrin domain-containing protein [Ignavibacteriaceae bacterium]
MPIKRHEALQPLSRDHHHGLILAQQLKKRAPQYKGMPATIEEKKNYTVSFYNSDLKEHFWKEEEILFPMVKNRDTAVDALINEILEEHRKIEKIILKFKAVNDFENKLDELGWLLEKHIRKEERSLFGEIENLLTNDELEELKIKLIEQ